MRTLVTGMNGTVAPALARVLRVAGHEVIPWDRATMPIDSEAAVRATLSQTRPEWVCHIATGPPDWATRIAKACATSDIRLLWTGTVSVFSESARAPLAPDRAPDATDDYGRYKIECERLITGANPRAIIARLGWQIGDTAGSNTMTDFLTRAATAGLGTIDASTRWIPSCAFLDDTAAALRTLMHRAEPGLFHLEGNSAGLSLFDIASALGRLDGRDWRIIPTDQPARDNRMRDDRIRVGQVAERLGLRVTC